MVALLFLLALLALGGGVALFVADSRERAAQSNTPKLGPQRRERKTWAQERGFEYAKQDEMLAGEWHRGAASDGAQLRDVISSNAFGHPFHIVDLAGTTVIAMRTGAESNVVVDMRRDGFTPATDSEDLVKVSQVADFTVWGTHPGAVGRFVDKRVRTALEQLPPSVSAVWCEGEWALAQLSAPGTEDWDAVLAPLGLVADAARTLPPAEDAPLELPFAPREETAPVQRPEDPVELPTRRTGGERGEQSGIDDLEDRGVGDDDVEAIAGTEHRTDLNRVRRRQTPPSIFDEEE